ncbi:hypothetical protein [Actinomycetospora termitidis]|uniref:Uncharacterized protein n=1 Tax=Actinomycetospora termitidis TaxID=3053470 RepID=A0ABT7MES4_9PSEU|nr:hypothetical protein [Actinomycetospora sp. Odt1-22]MDL5158951.1 hypothetical protein [Actinomycetospora sp. Odt1-22]
MADVAGTIEGWFARETRRGGPIEAMAFGHRALVIAVPRARGLDDDGHQYVLHRYEFDASTLRSAHVRHQPPRRTPSSGAGRSGAPDGGPPPRHAAGLDPDFVQTLSGLPPRARALLEGPYLEHDDVVLRYDSFWWANPDEGDLRPFIVIMASARRAALGVGRRLIPPGHDRSTAHWQLTCWDARVVKRTER